MEQLPSLFLYNYTMADGEELDHPKNSIATIPGLEHTAPINVRIRPSDQIPGGIILENNIPEDRNKHIESLLNGLRTRVKEALILEQLKASIEQRDALTDISISYTQEERAAVREYLQQLKDPKITYTYDDESISFAEEAERWLDHTETPRTIRANIEGLLRYLQFPLITDSFTHHFKERRPWERKMAIEFSTPLTDELGDNQLGGNKITAALGHIQHLKGYYFKNDNTTLFDIFTDQEHLFQDFFYGNKQGKDKYRRLTLEQKKSLVSNFKEAIKESITIIQTLEIIEDENFMNRRQARMKDIQELSNSVIPWHMVPDEDDESIEQLPSS